MEKIIFEIINIIIIVIGLYLGYKNYKELIRKNNIDESPYLKITFTDKSGDEILFKNYGKTPVNINNIFIYDYKYNPINYIKDDILNNKKILKDIIPKEIMPNEEIIVNYNDFSLYMTPGKFIIKIEYENHIKKLTKDILINIKDNTIEL